MSTTGGPREVVPVPPTAGGEVPPELFGLRGADFLSSEQEDEMGSELAFPPGTVRSLRALGLSADPREVASMSIVGNYAKFGINLNLNHNPEILHSYLAAPKRTKRVLK